MHLAEKFTSLSQRMTIDFKNLLAILEISKDINDVTIKDINVAFRKLALKLHPDKAGDEKTAAFQKLRNAHQLLTQYILEQKTSGEVDDEEEKFFKENFQNFNFPCENQGSFTVYIEDFLAETWQSQF